MPNNNITKNERNIPEEKISRGKFADKGIKHTFAEIKTETSLPKRAYIRVFTPLLEEYMKDSSFVDSFLDFVGADCKTIKSTDCTLFYGDTIDNRANNVGGTYIIELESVSSEDMRIVGLLKEPSHDGVCN